MRVACVALLVVVDCAPSRASTPTTPDAGPPAAAAPAARRAGPAAALAPAAAAPAASAPTRTPDPVLLGAARVARNVAVVRVLDQRPYVWAYRGGKKVPAVNLAVLRWIKPIDRYHPQSVHSRTEPTDPKFRDGAVYVLAFDDYFGGKTAPSMLKANLAKELAETDALAEADALAVALNAP